MFRGGQRCLQPRLLLSHTLHWKDSQNPTSIRKPPFWTRSSRVKLFPLLTPQSYLCSSSPSQIIFSSPPLHRTSGRLSLLRPSSTFRCITCCIFNKAFELHSVVSTLNSEPSLCQHDRILRTSQAMTQSSLPIISKLYVKNVVH